MAAGPEFGGYTEEPNLLSQVEQGESLSLDERQVDGVETEKEKEIKRRQEVQELLEEFEGLENDDGENIEGFDVFSHFLLHASSDIQEDFLNEDFFFEIEDYIFDTGAYPVNSYEFGIITEIVYPSSLVEGEGVDNTQAESNDTQVESNEAKYDNIIDFKDIVTDIKISKELQALFDRLPDTYNGDISIVTDIISYLENSHELEKVILPAIYEKSEADRNAFVGVLASISPDLSRKAITYFHFRENEIPLPPQEKILTSSALGVHIDQVDSQAEQSGNIFTIDGVDGTEINYDVVTNERSISLDGYTIETDMDDMGDYQTPKLKYMRVEQSELPKLNVIQSISTVLTEKQVDTEDLAEIKATITSFSGASELGIDFASMDSGEMIQARLSDLFTKTKESLDSAREEYRDELVRLRDQHAGVLAQKDKRVRSTLGLLQGTGVTQMPQYVFAQVAETININPNEYGFQTQIDLEEGILGFDASGDNENNDRVRFAQMVNVMLGVEEGSTYAINPQAVNGIGKTAIQDRNEFNTYVAEDSGWHEVGAASTILQRLRNRDQEK